MRCNICDVVLSEPTFNRDLNRWEPCDTCLDVIRDTVGAFIDRPFMDEDEAGQHNLPLEDIFNLTTTGDGGILEI